jgi:serine/threonine protein kinase
MFAKAIDDYELIKNIGKGSYGQVFLAKEKSQKEKNSIMLS